MELRLDRTCDYLIDFIGFEKGQPILKPVNNKHITFISRLQRFTIEPHRLPSLGVKLSVLTAVGKAVIYSRRSYLNLSDFSKRIGSKKIDSELYSVSCVGQSIVHWWKKTPHCFRITNSCINLATNCTWDLI